MREIKFRAWDIDLEEYVDFSGLDIPVESLNTSTTMTWEQYTGLHDKNGKDIYEGDILELSNSDDPDYDYVMYCGSAFSITRGALIEDLCEATVYGNIHENPEFLK